jgi:hypothetical protein
MLDACSAKNAQTVKPKPELQIGRLDRPKILQPLLLSLDDMLEATPKSGEGVGGLWVAVHNIVVFLDVLFEPDRRQSPRNGRRASPNHLPPHDIVRALCSALIKRCLAQWIIINKSANTKCQIRQLQLRLQPTRNPNRQTTASIKWHRPQNNTRLQQRTPSLETNNYTIEPSIEPQRPATHKYTLNYTKHTAATKTATMTTTKLQQQLQQHTTTTTTTTTTACNRTDKWYKHVYEQTMQTLQ